MIKLFLNETVSGKQGTLDGDGFELQRERCS